MDILVTGCNGFIGREICYRLYHDGHTVYGIGTAPKSSACLSQYYVADITSNPALNQIADALNHIDVLIHCAAYISYDDTDSKIMSVNVCGTQNIVTLAKQIGVKTIIYCSGSTVIGTPQITPITETHPLVPQTMYHVSKLAGEYIVMASGLPSVVLRIPSPIGVGMNPHAILSRFVENCVKNEKIELYGNGSRVQNYVAVEDVATAVARMLHADQSGIYNLSGIAISNRDLAYLCKEITHSFSEIIFSAIPDPADGQVWDISAKKIADDFGFVPTHRIEDTITALMKSWIK